ncbi:MAG TPA: hypothetical protein QF621_06465, partial [Candidatus Thalassarchaeaceae archaeon]|nr:hypothetical protein [Candidatus Thalassarchaeaceae archaeon]
MRRGNILILLALFSFTSTILSPVIDDSTTHLVEIDNESLLSDMKDSKNGNGSSNLSWGPNSGLN